MGVWVVWETKTRSLAQAGRPGSSTPVMPSALAPVTGVVLSPPSLDIHFDEMLFSIGVGSNLSPAPGSRRSQSACPLLSDLMGRRRQRCASKGWYRYSAPDGGISCRHYP